MTSWTLGQELHANTRRTRITLRGWLNDTDVALKCYKAPFFGLFHWYRTHRKAQKLRDLNIPLPDVIFSGWLPSQGCFCIAYRFMDNHERLQERLARQTAEEARPDVEQLIQLFIRCHRVGVMQTDANLTNFLVSPDNHWVILDEDDLELTQGPLPEKDALFNLAAAIRRVPGLDAEGHYQAWCQYVEQGGQAGKDSFPRFEALLQFWQKRLENKIRKRKN